VSERSHRGPKTAAAASTASTLAAPAGPILFAGTFGCLLGIALLKFGNPIILDRLIEVPKDSLEFAFQAWPVRWGYALLLGCAALGCTTLRLHTRAPKWAIILPAAWFGWQVVSTSISIAPGLTQATLMHFAACLLCFYLGLFCLGAVQGSKAFWIPLLAAFGFVLWMGFEQHYGGLEATRKMFYQQPGWQQFPPEYIKKIESNRIFSTLVYPNALAGAILLLVPAMLLLTWRITARLTEITRGVLVGLLAYAATACLFWSGSKSGWLIGMVLILATLLRLPVSKRLKSVVVVGIVAVGLTGFFVKFASYFHRGAPSVSARFEYWRAGFRTALANPVFGTGPGTFSVAYRKIKPPGAEMAQLVHNDYLEQASDSGAIGCLTYTIFVLGSAVLLARPSRAAHANEDFVVWLGLLGWSLQSFVEFLLYIPGLAWPAFTFFGWLWARNQSRGNE
jgi:O-antigen ligase